jgi:hypothetical protein
MKAPQKFRKATLLPCRFMNVAFLNHLMGSWAS